MIVVGKKGILETTHSVSRPVREGADLDTLADRHMHIGKLVGTPVYFDRLTGTAGAAGVYAALLAMAYNSHRNMPPYTRFLLGTVWFAAWYGAETLHYAGHIMAARAVGAPMRELRFAMGLQRPVFESEHITPGQHMGRAAGGLAVSAVLSVITYRWWRATRRLPFVGAIMEAIFVCNALSFLVAVVPTPLCDGGGILKWAVAGATGEEALGEEAVQTAGFGVVVGIVFAGVLFALRGRPRYAISTFGMAALIVADLLVLRGKV
jgi:hypothetical protein